MRSYPHPRRRANGEGSIYRTAEGRWRAALTWTDPSGQQQRRVLSGKNQSDVRRRLAELRADLDRGLEPAKAGTLAAYLAGWLERESNGCGLRPGASAKESTRVYIVPALGTIPLAKLTPSDVERMTAGIVERGLSPRTAGHARVHCAAAGRCRARRADPPQRGRSRRPPKVPSRTLEPVATTSTARSFGACWPWRPSSASAHW